MVAATSVRIIMITNEEVFAIGSQQLRTREFAQSVQESQEPRT
jgi:hypothetical protein